MTDYQVDGGPLQPVPPTTGHVSVALQMTGPHSVYFASMTQYQVNLDSGASASLQSITPPTVPGDSYWYDSGSTVTLVAQLRLGEGLSSGSRLVSYSTDGGANSDPHNNRSRKRLAISSALFSSQQSPPSW